MPKENTAQKAAQESTKTSASTVVMGGVILSFPHTVRSTKNVDLPGGQVQHRLNIEYLGLDEQHLSDAIKKAVSSNGYTLAGPTERDGTLDYLVMSGSDRKGIFAVTPAGPSLHLHLNSPGARGVVYVEWVGK